jgi:hypothetical protein
LLNPTGDLTLNRPTAQIRDALFDACDALACKQGRVLMLARLCLEPECRRGHGGVYDAMNSGEVCPTVLTTRAATQIGHLEVG